MKLVSEGGPEPGQTIFTTSGTFTVPDKVKEIECFLVGGGGATGTYTDIGNPGDGCGGGGGGYTKTEKLSVRPGDEINVTVGNGGATYYTKNSANEITTFTNAGGSTVVDTIISAGGSCGNGTRGACGGSGGSGGGGGYVTRNTISWPDGGSNGSNGKDGGNHWYWAYDRFLAEGGTGQGTTTRAFGEPDGTLYAGGGGGGGQSDKSIFARGGDGGGGNGGHYSKEWGYDGQTNTGGGAGGGIGRLSCNHGGSGIAIIRWGY